MTPGRRRLRVAGLLLGPAAFVLCLSLLPGGPSSPGAPTLDAAGRLSLALMAWMGIWWLSEAIDVRATALLPLVVLPFSGVQSLQRAAAPYASPIIFLFLGGFLLAFGMRRWGLDRRIALGILSRVGARPARMIGGFMIATALLSACVSNTATCAMMLPIALSVCKLIIKAESSAQHSTGFEPALFLGIAYAASIGGLATEIGSPPNGLMAEICSKELGIEITFVRWLAIGLPLSLVFLPICWWLLTRVLHPVPREEIPGGRELIQKELESLGPLKAGEIVVMVVFAFTTLAWITRPLLKEFIPGLHDAGIAITAGLSLFLIPIDRKGNPAMVWKDTRGLPFGLLILFGGGLSLANAIKTHGVATFIGGHFAALEGLPNIVLILLITTFVVFLTELTSNTATAATLIPLLASMAPGLGVPALTLVVPATLAASCAFMLPVATPPNAIVFGSGMITMQQMSRAGLWLNLIAIALICALTEGVLIPFFL